MSTESEEPRLIAGRYRLRSVLGSGAMGTVWAAYDEFLQRPVAVKEVRLPPGVLAAQVEELRERTLREARAIAVLSHPNVITLHDVAKENDEPFVVMELLPSRSLAALLRDHGPLNTEQAAAVGDAVAGALEAAHEAGITHRDVKPGNVLVSSDGRIKLTDFGISRSVSEVTMTRTGMMLGSPAYISPEVASGGTVTPAADLWGLGTTLFTAVRGTPPYDADGDPLETVGLVVHGDVPKPPPGPLAPLIEKLMAKEPLDRISLREVRRLLRPMLAAAPHALFEAERFVAKDNPVRSRPDATVTQVIPAARPAEHRAGGSGGLAADPGPLPFAKPARPGTPGRGPLAGTTLAVVAVLLFVLAAVGGFAASRRLGAQPITPPEPVARQPAVSAQQTPLEMRIGDATNLRGAKGGFFRVQVPRDWAKFVTQQTGEGLPPSTLVQFVSPDGRQVLNIERFAEYFPGRGVDQYLKALELPWSRGNFVRVSSEPLDDGEEGAAITYRTVEQAGTERPSSAGSSTVGRTTFTEAVRRNTNLWAVSMTVPTESEDISRATLFDRIVPTFSTTD
nr:serine/threonine-protein kinase [Amycolatopsis nigrescens]